MSALNAQKPVSPRCTKRFELLAVTAVLVLVALAPAAGFCMIVIGDAGASWLSSAVMSSRFILWLGLAVVSSVGLSFMICLLWYMGRTQRVQRTEAGSVVLEFALALPIALGLSLIMAQSSLVMAGHLCVQYSAFTAARTAIVQIPRDLIEYGEPSNVIASGSSWKIDRIRQAALWPLTPLSSGVAGGAVDPAGDDAADALRAFIYEHGGSSPWWLEGRYGGDYLGRKWAYAYDNTDVTVLRRASSQFEPPEYVEPDWPYEYEEHEEVRVYVEHDFYLAVPYASRLLAALGDGYDLGTGMYVVPMAASSSLTNEGARDYIPVEVFE